ncbi:hypothetical protein IMSHALPRED_007936 [Imshaugia aleurites]|uniref:Elongin-A n=1 Tax=Imshaugia aleurites TaxID=172621 RepID=A0A8H3FRI3_9LECA|nr:hypothetical protein IMSHALPRED_007936 [Imshaugia aleurites]
MQVNHPITDVGDAPYQLVRSVLLRVENPQQLRQIELASPQICGQDGEIWLEFIKRDVPNWDKKPYRPENPKKWYKAYKRLVMDSQKEVEDDAAELKATLDQIKQVQALNKAQQVELKGVKVPEGMKSNGPVISLSTMPRFYEKPSYPPPSERQLAGWKMKESGEIKDTKDAKVFVSSNKGKLEQFRKEAKAMGHFQKPARRAGTWTPNDMKSRPAPTHGKVTVAPRILIEEHRKAAVPTVLDPSIKPPVVFAPKRRRVERDEASQPGGLTNEERERRLKAFTNPSSASKSTTTQEAPVSRSAASPHLEAKSTSPTVPTLATAPVPKVQSSPISSPLKRKDRASPIPVPRVPRANTSSPSNGGARPAMQLKKKAPVDVFMPAKRRKIA